MHGFEIRLANGDLVEAFVARPDDDDYRQTALNAAQAFCDYADLPVDPQMIADDLIIGSAFESACYVVRPLDGVRIVAACDDTVPHEHDSACHSRTAWIDGPDAIAAAATMIKGGR